MLRPANGTSDIVGGALPIESTRQTVRTNGCGTKLAYRRGKREGGKESASKHQIRSRNGRWVGRRGVGQLNPRRETKIQGANWEVSEGKADLDHGLFSSYEGQQGAANGQDSSDFLRDVQGFRRLDADSLDGFTRSTSSTVIHSITSCCNVGLDYKFKEKYDRT